MMRVRNVTGHMYLIRSSCLVEFQVDSGFYPLLCFNVSVVTCFIGRGNSRAVIYLLTLRIREGGKASAVFIFYYIQ